MGPVGSPVPTLVCYPFLPASISLVVGMSPEFFRLMLPLLSSDIIDVVEISDQKITHKLLL